MGDIDQFVNVRHLWNPYGLLDGLVDGDPALHSDRDEDDPVLVSP